MTSIDWKKISLTAPVFLALALEQVWPTSVHAADYDVGSIHIRLPWARATPKGASSGAAYVTIANKDKYRIASRACRATSPPRAKFTL